MVDEPAPREANPAGKPRHVTDAPGWRKSQFAACFSRHQRARGELLSKGFVESRFHLVRFSRRQALGASARIKIKPFLIPVMVDTRSENSPEWMSSKNRHKKRHSSYVP